jgi:hypothetical protein
LLNDGVGDLIETGNLGLGVAANYSKPTNKID